METKQEMWEQRENPEQPDAEMSEEEFLAGEQALFADDVEDGERYILPPDEEAAQDGETEWASAKPQTDAEWGDWRKKTEARAQKLAQEELASALQALLEPEEAGPAPAEAAQAEGERALAAQLAQIGQLDPGIRGFEDLLALPEFEQFDRLVMQGQDLVSAFKLATYGSFRRQEQAAQRQAALNRMQSKAHLTRTPVGSVAALIGEIPEDALPLWREMFPEDSPARLRERYQATL